jgi:cytochrome b561
MQDTQRYTSVAVALHWIIAALIAATFALGVYMHELELSPVKLKLYSYHKWIGVTIFLLVVFRLFWRLTHTPPAPVAMAAWQRRAAAGAHVALYLFTLSIPLSGWLMSSASGFQVVYLGLVPIPDLIARNKELAGQLKELHQSLNFLMLAVVFLHVAAALKHHFVDRDGVLARMLPGLESRKEQA